MPEIKILNQNTRSVEDNGVRFFILEGEREALMIDSGMNTPDALKIAEGLTALPIKLLNTHADPDHISGNGAFEEFYMHPDELGNYTAHGGSGRMLPVKGGDVIDLGGRELLIIDLPGHTPGSIAVLDRRARILFGGDSIQSGRIFMFGERRSLDDYIDSLAALWEHFEGGFDCVFPSHADIPVSPALIPKLIAAAKNIKSGAAKGHETPFMGRNITVFDFGFATFLCDGNI